MISSGALAGIIIAVVLICFFISYRKRKLIAETSRRASDYIVRSSVKLRKSIASKFGF